MKTVETNAIVAENGQLTLQLQAPPDVLPGEYRVLLVIEETTTQPVAQVEHLPLDFPVFSVGPWPADLSLRREDVYDDQL